MPDLPARLEDDQNELNRVKWCHYIFAGFLALAAAGTVLTGFGYGFYSVLAVPMAAITALGTALWAFANFKSAQAIGQRDHSHITYYVAGLNAFAFPIGTLLSWYTYSVMRRENVQLIYSEGIRPEPKPGGDAASKRLDAAKQAVNAKLAQQKKKIDEIEWPDAAAHLDEAEEKLWADIEAKHKGESADAAPKGEEKASDGPIRLIPSDD